MAIASPALVYINTVSNSADLGAGLKTFSLKELLGNDNGHYILLCTIRADGGTPQDLLHFAEYLVTKYGDTIAIAQMADAKNDGNSFVTDKPSGVIEARWQGRRYVSVLIWKCAGI
jgi:hypothetical protein